MGPPGKNGARLAIKALKDNSDTTLSRLGAKVSRATVGARSRTSGGERVLMSAKKRTRQSKYARRKGKVVITLLVLDGRSTGAVLCGSWTTRCMYHQHMWVLSHISKNIHCLY